MKIETHSRQSLEDRRKLHQAKEQGWIKRRMAHNEHFEKLAPPQQEYAHFGRTYVVWVLHHNRPHIRALLRVSGFEVNHTHGLKLKFEVADPTSDPWEFEASHQPKRLGFLPVYLWLPAYCDLRFVPLDQTNPKGTCLLSTTFMLRTEERYKLRMTEGMVHFSAVKDFNEAWPAHAII